MHVRSVERAASRQTKRRKARGLICYCHSYPFPHAKASMRFCVEHPRAAKSYYVIPKCYAGDRPPRGPLPAGCDRKNLQTYK